MSEFNFNFSDQSTLNFGKADADHELTAILNLACPDSRKWFLKNESALLNSVGTGQLLLHLKFWNKPKPSLLNGNVANWYVDYVHPNQALDFVTAFFNTKNSCAIKRLKMLSYIYKILLMFNHMN